MSNDVMSTEFRDWVLGKLADYAAEMNLLGRPDGAVYDDLENVFKSKSPESVFWFLQGYGLGQGGKGGSK